MPCSVTTSAGAAHPVRHIATGVPAWEGVKTTFDVREVRRRRAAIVVARAIRQAGSIERSRLIPAFGFDAALRRDSRPRPAGSRSAWCGRDRRATTARRWAFRRLDEHERRGQAAIALRTDEIAARERIAEQHLVVARIEERAPRRPTAVRAGRRAGSIADGFDGPLHLDVGFAFDGVASSCQTRGHAPRRALLSTGPGELVTTDLEAVVRRAHRQDDPARGCSVFSCVRPGS